MKTFWRKIAHLPLWRQSLLAGLLCTIVILSNIGLGLVAEKLFYSFWFSVFLFGFTPVWMACYGLMFATRWKWHEMALGVLVSVYVIVLIGMRGGEDGDYVQATALGAAALAVCSMTLGHLCGRLGAAIWHDLRRLRAAGGSKDRALKG